ncbi:hypothetical protein [Holdemania filiformis]|uniref:hypothetical protein n=1 Tax=Holdemania filiformis TaxID=61171 RepID=UPI0026745783|nr:hypothetical protein [Holdemania filiformis]
MNLYAKNDAGWKKSTNQYIKAQSDNTTTETDQSGAFLQMTMADRPMPFTVTGNGLMGESEVDPDAYKVFDNNDSSGLYMGSDHRWEGGHRASCWFGTLRIRAKKIILKTGNRINPANTVRVLLHPAEGSEVVVWTGSPEANSTYTITVPAAQQVEIKGISVDDQSQAYQRIEIKTCQITEWILVERKSSWRKVVKHYVKRADKDVAGVLTFNENFYDKYRDTLSLSGKSSCFRSVTETWGSGWTNTTDDSGYMYFGDRRIVPKKIVMATGSESNRGWNFWIYGIKEDGSLIAYLNGENIRAWQTRTVTITDATPIKGIRFRQTAAAYNNIQVQYCRITEWEEPGIITAWQPV